MHTGIDRGKAIAGETEREVWHGGDIYRNDVDLDFSVNINPFGMPERVKKALVQAVEQCVNYPEPSSGQLRDALSKRLGISQEKILIGNGASELFLAIARAIHPRKVLLPVPSFLGYEYALASVARECVGCNDTVGGCIAVDCVTENLGAEEKIKTEAAGSARQEILYYELQEARGFALDEGILAMLDQGVDLIFLAQPNNPVGNLIEEELLERILYRCREKGIWVVLDECFLPMIQGGEKLSFLRAGRLETYPNLMVVRAFTKTYAMPGVRLGYLVCSDIRLLNYVKRQLPEWNVSVLAQEAGLAALCEEADDWGNCGQEREQQMGREAYIGRKGQIFGETAKGSEMERLAAEIYRLRRSLARRLEEFGFRVYEGAANFIFLKSEVPLYEKLLERGILIRDCRNYKGLGKGYYRIAVRTEEENVRLVHAISEILQDGK